MWRNRIKFELGFVESTIDTLCLEGFRVEHKEHKTIVYSVTSQEFVKPKQKTQVLAQAARS